MGAETPREAVHGEGGRAVLLRLDLVLVEPEALLQPGGHVDVGGARRHVHARHERASRRGRHHVEERHPTRNLGQAAEVHERDLLGIERGVGRADPPALERLPQRHVVGLVQATVVHEARVEPGLVGVQDRATPGILLHLGHHGPMHLAAGTTDRLPSQLAQLTRIEDGVRGGPEGTHHVPVAQPHPQPGPPVGHDPVDGRGPLREEGDGAPILDHGIDQQNRAQPAPDDPQGEAASGDPSPDERVVEGQRVPR